MVAVFEILVVVLVFGVFMVMVYVHDRKSDNDEREDL